MAATSSDFAGNHAEFAGSAVALEREAAGSSFASQSTSYRSNEGPPWARPR